jgi:hypothetical protein
MPENFDMIYTTPKLAPAPTLAHSSKSSPRRVSLSKMWQIGHLEYRGAPRKPPRGSLALYMPLTAWLDIIKAGPRDDGLGPLSEDLIPTCQSLTRLGRLPGVPVLRKHWHCGTKLGDGLGQMQGAGRQKQKCSTHDAALSQRQRAACNMTQMAQATWLVVCWCLSKYQMCKWYIHRAQTECGGSHECISGRCPI